MEEFSDLEEWEFLPKSSDFDAFQGFGDAVKPNYFSLNSNEAQELPFGGEIEQGSSSVSLGPVSDLSVVGRSIEEGKGEVLAAEDAGMVVDFWGIGRDAGVEVVEKEVESVGCESSVDDEFNVGIEVSKEDLDEQLTDSERGEIVRAENGIGENGVASSESVGISASNDDGIEVSSKDLDESLINSEKGEIVRAEDGIGENGVESGELVGILASNGDGMELTSNDSNVPLLVDRSIEEIAVGDSEGGEVFRAEDAGKELESTASGDGTENRRMIWWRMPIELFKFCTFGVRPVWSVSVAAAIVGIFVIRRRLNRMNHKSRSIPLRISIGDKKPSQVTIHAAARLNEAFTAVQRVPVIRSSLQAGGSTPWPIVSLR